MYILLLILFVSIHCQTIQQLPEIAINEELPIGTIVTFLPDKIPNLDQSVEYDLVTPLSAEFDVFSIDHQRHLLVIKKRIDFESLCQTKLTKQCLISISIAVSNHDKIDVYLLPIEIKNLDDNPLTFAVNRTVIEIDENDSNWHRKSYALPRASDADGDFIRYSILFLEKNLFEFDEENLLLKPLKSFDREEKNFYLFRLFAWNQHEKNISIDIIIKIKDVNDHTPQCQLNSTVFIIRERISTFHLNAIDLDEDENSRLIYRIVNPIAGFSIDQHRGDIKFDYSKYFLGSSMKLTVNISDQGKPIRLSSECSIEFHLTFLYDIQFQLNQIDNLRLPIGYFQIQNQTCSDCRISMNSSLGDLLMLKDDSFDLYLNEKSLVLFRILSNLNIEEENLLIDLEMKISHRTNHLIYSQRNLSISLNLNKRKLLENSKILFLKIHENTSQIHLPKNIHSCLQNDILIDSTNTFELNSDFLLSKKPFEQSAYNLILQSSNCSIDLHIHIINRYSLINVYPYLSQTFVVLPFDQLATFKLPSLPIYAKYSPLNSNEIIIDQRTNSIRIQSTRFQSIYAHDFQIDLIDSRMPSLSSMLIVRILFGENLYAPKLIQKSLDNIQAYDPDLNVDQQEFPPAIEYEIESPSNDIEIDRYTGRLKLKHKRKIQYNFTVKFTDFGRSSRLITREQIVLQMPTNAKEISMKFSTVLLLISIGCLCLILLFIFIMILIHILSSRKRTEKKSHFSPTTPDRYLIDNEYVSSCV
mgnify:FL=1